MTELAEQRTVGQDGASAQAPNPVPPITKSVIERPGVGTPMLLGDFIINMTTIADDLPAWGTQVTSRDRKLREFWPTEPILASALFSTIARYASFGYTLDGPPAVVERLEEMMSTVDGGYGWEHMISKVLLDLFSQDNGAFIEHVREDNRDPRSPVVTMNQLESWRCWRTGNPREPVWYYDMKGGVHKLQWWHVVPLTEMPSPIEWARGMQYCAVTRLLRAAQVMRDISIYYREKISGRFTRAMYFVSGVSNLAIQDALKSMGAEADASGTARYIQPVVVAGLDPTAKVDVAQVLLAALPDGFDYEEMMRWYVNQLALAFGGDYQDYAPLPGGNLGTAQQSQTLHMKSRAKGPRLFMKLIERAMNYTGAFPRNVMFKYGDQDISEDMDHTKLATMRAEERAVRIKSGEISPQVARQLAADYGDLDERFLPELADFDAEMQAREDAQREQDLIAKTRSANPRTGDTTPDNPPVTARDVARSSSARTTGASGSRR